MRGEQNQPGIESTAGSTGTRHYMRSALSARWPAVLFATVMVTWVSLVLGQKAGMTGAQIHEGSPLENRAVGSGMTANPVSRLVSQPYVSANGLRKQDIEIPGKFVTAFFLDREEPLTGEELNTLKAELASLLKAGTMAIPEIRYLLDSREDRLFSQFSAAILGYETFRLALIELLARIGGIEAELLLAENLVAFQSFAELEALSTALEFIQPGYYSAPVRELASEQLNLLYRTSAPDPDPDAAALFRIFQLHGNGQSVALLNRAPHWLRDYAQLSLAQLPDGQGIEALLRHAHRDMNSSGGGKGLHLLAQMAPFNRNAENALLFLARAGNIPDSTWPAIAEILMGDQQLQTENPALLNRAMGSVRKTGPYSTHTTVHRQTQEIYSVNYSAVLSREQVRFRISLLAHLAEVTESTVAIDSLWAAYDMLRDHYPVIP